MQKSSVSTKERVVRNFRSDRLKNADRRSEWEQKRGVDEKKCDHLRACGFRTTIIWLMRARQEAALLRASNLSMNLLGLLF
jgi:hypothetical protein